MSSTPKGNPNTRNVRVGKYQILSHVATGGMGAVYRALNTETDQVVALKVLSPELAARPNLVERFRREARSASKLRHKNIITVLECGESKGTHFLAMEFIDGKDLSDYLRDKGQIDVRLAWVLMRQATKALCHAHEKGIVHRDIKPSNFLLTKKDKRPLLKLADLGLAREVNEEQFRVTTDGTTVGTVDYMSPEQAKDSANADARSDIYSLGCAFYHMLAGKPPFEGSLTERILKHLNDPPEDLNQLNPNVPWEFKAVLEKMLAKNPNDRYQTARELLKVLNEPPSGLLEHDSSQELPEAKDVLLPNPEELRIADSDPMPETQVPQDHGTDEIRDETEIVPTNTPPSTPIHEPEPVKRKQTDTPMPAMKAVPKKRLKLAEEAEETPKPRAKPSNQEQPAKPRKRREKEKVSSANYWPWIGAGVGLAVIAFIVIVIIMMMGGNEPEPDPSDKKPPPPIAQPGTNGKNQRIQPIPVPNQKDPKFPQPGPVENESAIVKDPKAAEVLLKLYEGPHQQAVDKFTEAKVYRIARTPLKEQFAVNESTYSSLAKAMENLPKGQPAILEIHDNGPLYEMTVPKWQQRDILIRPGKGFRPLIVWDIAQTEKNPPPWPTHFLAVENGSLRIENVAFVAHWQDSELLKSSDFFSVTNGSLSLIGCSVSVSGQHQKQLSLCRFAGSGEKLLHRIERCYLRAENCVILNMDGPGHDVLVRDSLFVNGNTEPLILGKAGIRATTLRMLRSTMVTGQRFLSVKPLLQVDDDMNFQFLACDTLLASHGNEPTQALLDLQGPSYVQAKWSVYNCLYSGWKELQHSPEKIILPANLNGWRREWYLGEVDAVSQKTWPAMLTSNYHHMSVKLFRVEDTPADFSAVTVSGKIGCPLDGLIEPDLSELAAPKE